MGAIKWCYNWNYNESQKIWCNLICKVACFLGQIYCRFQDNIQSSPSSLSNYQKPPQYFRPTQDFIQ